MKIIFEIGDKVKIKDEWRDWKKGEVAIVKKWHPPSPGSCWSYLLEPTDGSKKDFYTMLDYMLEPECTLPPVSQQRELLLAWERWKVEKGNYPEYRTKDQMLNDYLSQ
jgi:hypothetical protein